jgi:hypothetical protein
MAIGTALKEFKLDYDWASEGPPPHRPAGCVVQVGRKEKCWWDMCGCAELDEALSSGAVALLSGRWLIGLASKGGVLQPRQALPDEVFLSPSQVQQATRKGWLPVVCISHCWLQPDQPDPRGHNLRVIARALEAFVCLRGQVAVFYDFCSMHQKCRGTEGAPGVRVLGFADGEAGAVGRYPSETVLFKEALGRLCTFFSYPNTHVWMLTAFPPDYDDPRRYEREGTNVARYADRGWCFCEASWAAMVKESIMLLDLGTVRGERALERRVIKDVCMRGRRAPMLPLILKEELARKRFTNGKDDRPAGARLYAERFASRFGSVPELTYY